jgi:histone H3/H4
MFSDRCRASLFEKVYNDRPRMELCMADLIVKAAVKDSLSEVNIASDFYDALDEEVKELIDDAAERAKANDRKTAQPRDL